MFEVIFQESLSRLSMGELDDPISLSLSLNIEDVLGRTVNEPYLE